ncbi:MAG TPA: hypothetical protein VFG54_05715 [Prolixibacteraceae bacterium]|nr:hypothetical protein [Prolixibacteraceae bacterium]
MAKVEDILSNKISGRVGNVVYATVNGQTVVRSLPRTNPDKRTPAQLRNQERFRLIHGFCAPFKRVLIPQIWNAQAKTDNGYNLFVKTNTPAFGPDGELTDPKKIRLSIGNLPLPEQIQVHRIEGSQHIQVSWQKSASLGGLTLKDKLMVISAGEGSFSEMMATGIKRVDLGGTFELPELALTATHIYLFFESLDQRFYSESVCVNF